MGVGYSVRFLEGWAPVMGSGHSVTVFYLALPGGQFNPPCIRPKSSEFRTNIPAGVRPRNRPSWAPPHVAATDQRASPATRGRRSAQASTGRSPLVLYLRSATRWMAYP